MCTLVTGSFYFLTIGELTTAWLGPDVSHGHQLAASAPETQASGPDREGRWGAGPSLQEQDVRGSACGGSAGRGGDARGVLHHGTLALQGVLVHGALLLLLETALLIAALIWAAVLPDARAAHHA